jgi:hypothetical protein
MKEALEHLADLVKHGDDALVKDNADDALPIWVAIDNIDDDLDEPVELCVNANGVYHVDDHGYLNPIPLYKVMS